MKVPGSVILHREHMAAATHRGYHHWFPAPVQSFAYYRKYEYTSGVMPKVALDPKHFDTLRQFKAEIFQVLAHPTRIHIIEILRAGEVSVGAILEQIKVEPANLSQHLSVLRLKHLVLARKDGNQVHYSLRDPLLVEVLDAMRKYFQRHFEDSIGMLKQMEASR